MAEATEEYRQAHDGLLAHHGVEAESRWIDVPLTGGRAHVLVTGGGPPVVAINGIGSPAAFWASLLPHLEGLTVYGIDLPGFGLTDWAPHLVEGYRGKAVSFVEQVLDGLGLDRVPVLANSLGSLWTLWLALDRPDRLAAMAHVGCPALVLGTSTPAPMRLLSVPWLNRLITRLDPPSPKQVARLAAMVNEAPLPDAEAALILAAERLPDGAEAFGSTVHTVLRLRGARPGFGLTADELAAVAHPTLLVWGRDDPFGGPDVGDRMARVIDGARLHVVPTGHLPWVHRAEQVGDHVRPFLLEHAG